MEKSKISVCICTRNRPDELRRCLDSIMRCEPRPFQVIVSDDSAGADLRSEAVCQQYPLVLYQRGPRLGLSANRNACLRACRSEWIHFIDDDVVVNPNFYSTSCDLLTDLPPYSIVTGWEKNFGDGGSTPREVRPPRHGFWTYMTPATEADFNCVVINATLFPRLLFNQIDFDEFFRYGCEESDISLHAVSVGYRLVFAPDLWVEHRPSTANRDVYRAWLVASQVYAGFKRQWIYKKSLMRTIAFAVFAVPRLLLYTLRHDGVRAFFDSIRQAGRGVVHFLSVSRASKHLQPSERLTVSV
jgi:GT2 family glycosyltransferase